MNNFMKLVCPGFDCFSIALTQFLLGFSLHGTDLLNVFSICGYWHPGLCQFHTDLVAARVSDSSIGSME